jgi:hypothetical protein
LIGQLKKKKKKKTSSKREKERKSEAGDRGDMKNTHCSKAKRGVALAQKLSSQRKGTKKKKKYQRGIDRSQNKILRWLPFTLSNSCK